jgi:hypothetical protein
MSTLRFLLQAAGSIVCAGLMTACAGTQPTPYSGIASSSRLRASPHDDGGHIPYEYRSSAALNQYGAFDVEPVAIYRGSDNQFEDVSEADKAELARYMQATFGDKLASLSKGRGFQRPETLRIRLTLTGAKESTPILSTLSRFDLVGGPYNAIQAARGKEGVMTGSVSFAVEIYSVTTNELLAAYVSKQYPNAWNIGASVGALSASKTGIDKGADELVAYLSKR